eukprot:scaffold14938_cov130-Isochrysis_galbana.AAC.13
MARVQRVRALHCTRATRYTRAHAHTTTATADTRDDTRHATTPYGARSSSRHRDMHLHVPTLLTQHRYIIDCSWCRGGVSSNRARRRAEKATTSREEQTNTGAMVPLAHSKWRCRELIRGGRGAQALPAFFRMSSMLRSPRSVAWYSSAMPVRAFFRASFDEAYSIFGLTLALSSDLMCKTHGASEPQLTSLRGHDSPPQKSDWKGWEAP